MSMKEISNYYKGEVEKLTSKDFMLESLSRHCASGINLVDALSEKELEKNDSVKEIKQLLVSVSNHVNKLQKLT